MSTIGKGVAFSAFVLTAMFIFEAAPARFATEQADATGNLSDSWAERCDAVDLSIDDNSFTWAGPPGLSHYTVTYCDGTTTGKVEAEWPDVTTIDLDKRIKTVYGKGGLCDLSAQQTCESTPHPVDPETPTWPVCPFASDENTSVIHFDGKGLISNGSKDEATSNPYYVDLTAGTYKVRSFSWDGYIGRDSDHEAKEQWYAILYSDETKVAHTSATTDLDDWVIEASVHETLNTDLVLHADVNKMYAKHAAYHTDERNSVQPVCIAFTKKIEVQQPEWPACPFTADKDTTVVYFDGKGLIANASSSAATSNIYNVPLSAGTYRIKTASWDGYVGREEHHQDYEQWYLAFTKDSKVVATTSATTDLKDGVISWLEVETLEDHFVLGTSTNALYAKHAAYPAEGRNSVQPICAAFTLKEQSQPPVIPAPVCEMSASPSSIKQGATSTITWSSTNAASVVFNPALGGSATSGSAIVAPATTTTYTATFTGLDGSTTIPCHATVQVTIDPVLPPAPTCDISVSASLVNRGDTVTLSWTSVNASSSSITPTLGTVATSGTTSVAVSGNTTYTLTVTAGDRTGTCSTAVSVRTPTPTIGGGGSCLNCGTRTTVRPPTTVDPVPTEPEETTVTLDRRVRVAGASVSLDQLPYTGFEAGPFMTALFWIALFVVSAIIAHVLTVVRPFERIRARREAYANGVSEAVHYVDMSTAPVAEPTYAHSIPSPIMVQSSVKGTASNDRTALIESHAHADNILLSPEAMRMIANVLEGEGDNAETVLTKLFNEVKSTYPREDGWVLLSKERCQRLISNMKNGVVTHVAPSTDKEDRPARVEKEVLATRDTAEKVSNSPVQQTKETQKDTRAVALFIGYLAESEQQKTFELLRTLANKGVDSGAFISQVVRDLDDVYKHRIEGGRNPDAQLAQLTAVWSNADFEQVMGILVECVDYSYSNTRIGTKVALTKAFEYFSNKK
jgi:hypothetical protein